jgi:hypothetical protein
MSDKDLTLRVDLLRVRETVWRDLPALCNAVARILDDLLRERS